MAFHGPPLPVLPQILKAPPARCCFCPGELTFGALTYPDWGTAAIPLVWHSAPHCRKYRVVPSSTAGVVSLFEHWRRARS